MTPALAPEQSAAPTTPAANPPGLREAFRVLLEHLGDHLELMRLEAGQELSRLGAVLGCWFALALLMQLGVTFGLTVLIASLWNTEYRTLAMLCSAAVLLLGMVFCWVKLQRLGAKATQRFTASSQQWQHDLALLRTLL